MYVLLFIFIVCPIRFSRSSLSSDTSVTTLEFTDDGTNLGIQAVITQTSRRLVRSTSELNLSPSGGCSIGSLEILYGPSWRELNDTGFELSQEGSETHLTVSNCPQARGLYIQCHISCGLYIQCHISCGLYIQCHISCGLYIQCHISCGLYIQCHISCGLYIQCHISCDLYIQCHISCGLYIQCHISCGLYIQCHISCGLYILCHVSCGLYIQCHVSCGLYIQCHISCTYVHVMAFITHVHAYIHNK